MRRFLVCLGVVAMAMGGCRAATDLDTAGPDFDPIAFFDGHVRSWGVIEDRSGAPSARIVTDCRGHRVGTDRLAMVQHLTMQDGSTTERNWVMRRVGPGRYEATANDMVGVADGVSDGRMFHWSWVLARQPGNWLMNVTMTQWMYRMDDGSAVIRTTVSKFGVIAAEVTEQFTHVGG